MRRTRAKLLFLTAPIVLAAGLAGSSLPRAAAAPPSAPRDESELAERMETISSGVKRMRKILQDATQRAECLEIVVEIQRSALEAKQGTPPLAQKLPEAERPAFVAAYRKLIAELLTKSLVLEVAFLDGEQAAIDEAYKELRAMEDKGHERFTEDG